MTLQFPQRRVAGTIGVVSSDLARYSRFCKSLVWLMKPEDARLIWTEQTDVVGNCNTICRNAVGDWVWIIGDDHTFQPDTLLRLIEHDVDIVVPLVFTRTPPYKPVVVDREVGETEQGHIEYAVFWPPETGLHEVHAAGSAGMLIRKRVLDAIGDPWFSTDGKGLNEDFAFCRKAREAGFKVWLDVDTQMGHMGTVDVWPGFRDGRWEPDLHLGPDTVVPLKNIILEDLPAAV